VISRRSFAHAPDAIMTARRFVVNLLRDVDPGTVEDVALMVSELATNSFRHADSSFTIVVDRSDTRLTVSVVDSGPGEPTVQSPLPAQPTGRGLRIVSALSDAWGVSTDDSHDGKSVWFTIDLASRARTSGSELDRRSDGSGPIELSGGNGNGGPRARAA
jgi:anti-sigma regulatory factor (Ser/Thr protein kinase)